tara:strand:+ start:330 stop:977 length:648 start_codon:yes stop_codon:yes gene_type:complete
MHYTKKDLIKSDRIKRLNIVNSISGIKSANLIGTISVNGQTNLSIVSSVIHIGSNPALIGFMMRPESEVRRHTFENIIESSKFTINQVSTKIIQNAHYTSAKFDSSESEFAHCHLNEEYLYGHKAPFVKESVLKIGLSLEEIVEMKTTNCKLIIGSVDHLYLPEEHMNSEGYLDLTGMNTCGIGGLNTYYSLKEISKFPYARVEQAKILYPIQNK